MNGVDPTETSRPAKIKSHHLEGWAIDYVRQSHPQQVQRHRESAQVQAKLRERALAWCWPAERIRVLDGDQGRSVTTTVGRDDFAWLLSEIALGHVGLVLCFQINRLARQEEVLASPQPLWAFWDLLLDRSNGSLNMEFIALANHRKAIRSEIAEYSRAFRRGQLGALANVIETSKSATAFESPEAIVLLLSAVSRFLTTENDFELSLGHAEVIDFIEQRIREIEGPRRCPEDT